MTTIIIGTSNPAKVQEVQRFLGDLPVAFQSMSDAELGIDIDESSETFEANVRAKLLAFSAATNQPVLACDGGLEIPALGGWPGVRTRRMGGDDRKTDDEIIGLLAAKIRSLPKESRSFAIVDEWGFLVPGGKPIIARGAAEGILLEEPDQRPQPGFPVRRFWWVPSLNKHFLDLTREELDQISHHKQALDRLRPAIEEYLEVNHA